MAYNNSGLLSMGSTYQLGQYSIRCFDTTEAGVRYVLAHISGPEGNSQTGIMIGSEDQIEGWYCEANESEVTIYSKIQTSPPFGEGPWPYPVNAAAGGLQANEGDFALIIDGGYAAVLLEPFVPYRYRRGTLLCSQTPTTGKEGFQLTSPWPIWRDISVTTEYTHNGLTVYYNAADVSGYGLTGLTGGENFIVDGGGLNRAQAAWAIMYGNTGGGENETFVARFPISIREAGGGPAGSDPSWGSDVGIWDEPGDVDYDREPEEPTKTLYLIGQGATSGRHNDPIVDPSYAYVPTPKDTVKSDGNGGDGGNGGGGGAGASTLITRPFGTGQADNKEITLHARRHGYGSTGGKGGKAGDGCILLYYRTEEGT